MADEPTDPADADEAAAEEADSGTDTEPAPERPTGTGAAGPSGKAATGAEAGTPARPVVRKKVASKRVTPKGGPVKGATPGSTAARAHSPGGQDAPTSARYTPPSAKYDQLPSPMWVPVLMFALLIIGALVIVGNYARVFGDPSNVYLVAGLGCILGGIITATNYR